jgi:hypothetical protein
MDPMTYIPARYSSFRHGRIVFWGHERSEAIAVELLPASLERIAVLLEYPLRRELHVVVYATNADARSALRREIGSAALLAPLHEPELAMIALQSPTVDPRNGDPRRMRRHLCHELAHVFSAERTGSVKHLGDGDRGMRLVSWVDEGFAESVAAMTSDRHDIIEQAMALSAARGLSDEELAAAFHDMGSRDREVAFAVATARVWRIIEERGWKVVFENLSTVQEWGLS